MSRKSRAAAEEPVTSDASPESVDAVPDPTGPVPQGSPPTDAAASVGPSPPGHPSDPLVDSVDVEDPSVPPDADDSLPEDLGGGDVGGGGAEEEKQDYLEDLRRVQAEFENYKKRITRQQSEHLERAAEQLVVKVLPVLDAGDLAMAHGGPEGEAVAQVVGMLYDTLQKEGLERLAVQPGDEFDPTAQDAVAHEPADDGEGPVVIEMLREGYRWKGRLIRPAMVRVKG